MRADWTGDARRHIVEATKDLPADATLKDRRKALNKAAGAFHCYTSWGRKVWSREVRRYLETYGLEPLRPAGPNPPRSAQQRKLRAAVIAGDVTFPFCNG